MTENEQLHADLENQDDQTDTEMNEVVEDELTLLKDRAKLMGIKFSNNIRIEGLREKIAAKQAGEEMPADEPTNKVNPLDAAGAGEEAAAPKSMSLREYMVSTQMKLVRLRIQNLDPKKKDLQGEVITVANEFLGTVRKFVPFGEVTDEGYHIPYCIYNMLSERVFLHIRTFKDKRTGQIQIEQKEVREFALEVLPPLTPKELAALATAQQAAGGLS